jgi:hypothetical protein
MTPRLSFAEAIEILAKLQAEGQIAVSVQEEIKPPEIPFPRPERPGIWLWRCRCGISKQMKTVKGELLGQYCALCKSGYQCVGEQSL